MCLLGARGVNGCEGVADLTRILEESVPTEPDRYENLFLASNKVAPRQPELSFLRKGEGELGLAGGALFDARNGFSYLSGSVGTFSSQRAS